MRSVLSTLLLLNSHFIASALRYDVNELLLWDKDLTFSESYMFSSENGPAMLEQGESYIELDTSVLITMKVNKTSKVGFAIYTCNEMNSETGLLGLCENTAAVDNDWIDNVSIFRGTWCLFAIHSRNRNLWNKKHIYYDTFLMSETDYFAFIFTKSHLHPSQINNSPRISVRINRSAVML